MYRRLYSFLNQNDFFAPQQFCFRKHHSTTHDISYVVDRITSAMEKKSHALGVFLDLFKALTPSTINNILLSKLELNGIEELHEIGLKVI